MGWAAAAPYIAAGGSALISGLMGRRRPRQTAPAQTITQESMLTPDQQRARGSLEEFYKTGKFGNYQAGESYGGSLGNYDMSNVEQGGLNQIMSQLQGGGGAMNTLNMGKTELQNLLSGNSMYDPTAEGGLYSSFQTQSARTNREAADRLKAQSAFGGRLMSQSTGRNLSNLNENTSNNLNSIYAQLKDTYAQRRLGGIGQASQLAGQEQAMQGQNIDQAMQYGGLQRMLENQKANTAYQEWQRSHQELAGTVGAAERLAYNPVQFGVRSFTMPAQYENQENPYQGFLNNMSGAGFNMMGQQYGNYLQNQNQN